MTARRAFLAGSLALPFAARAREAFDETVDPRTGTLTKALERAAKAGRPYRIRILPGTLVEKVTIAVADVTIVGSGWETVIVHGTYAGLKRPDGSDWGTGRTGTVTVSAPGVTLRNLTIRNSFDYIGAKRDNAGNGAQAVALVIDRNADRCEVEGCSLEGYQDTLYVQARSKIWASRIIGGVDFIFGGAAAWFEGCDIVTRYVPGVTEFGYVAAPSTPLVQPYGLVFHRCRLRHEPGVTANSTWLGRPWRAGGNMELTGQAVFLRCHLGKHIKRDGWTWMGYRKNGEQMRLTPQEARLFEYRSEGPGAGRARPTRKLLDDAAAADFTAAKVLGDWR